MSDATNSTTAFQDSTNASTSSNAPSSSAAGGQDRAWIAFGFLLISALIVIVREETVIQSLEARALRAEDQRQQALMELAEAKRAYSTELQLRRYNLDWFRTHEHAELEVRVGVLERISLRKR